jgi:hypothetical protein
MPRITTTPSSTSTSLASRPPSAAHHAGQWRLLRPRHDHVQGLARAVPGQAPVQDAVRPEGLHIPTGDGGDARDVVHRDAPDRGASGQAPLTAEAAGEVGDVEPGERALDTPRRGARLVYQADLRPG